MFLEAMRKFMSKQMIRLIIATVVMFFSAVVLPANASVESECREETRVYGMEAGIAEQYIQDCIASRGGLLPVDNEPLEIEESNDIPEDTPVVEEYTPSG
jgi:hypothetical protein